MLKNILKLNGAQQMSKQEQKQTQGGHNCTNHTRFCYFQCGGCNMGELNAKGQCICY